MTLVHFNWCFRGLSDDLVCSKYFLFVRKNCYSLIIENIMSNITLVFDTSAIATINTKKVMVAVPLLYIFMVFLQLFRLIISSRSSGSSKGPRSPGRGCATWAAVCLCWAWSVSSVSTSSRGRFSARSWPGGC